MCWHEHTNHLEQDQHVIPNCCAHGSHLRHHRTNTRSERIKINCTNMTDMSCLESSMSWQCRIHISASHVSRTSHPKIPHLGHHIPRSHTDATSSIPHMSGCHVPRMNTRSPESFAFARPFLHSSPSCLFHTHAISGMTPSPFSHLSTSRM